YGLMTLVATGGVMILSQIAPLSADWGVAKAPVALFGLTWAALPLAQEIDRVMSGVTRPLFGWVSDHAGRGVTMVVAFFLDGAAILLFALFGRVPVWFVLTTGLAFFGWGAAFSLFPALTGDLFGRTYATTNYSLLYTAKGTAALLVPLGSLLHEATGRWEPVLLLLVGFDWLSALVVLLVLPALRKRWCV